MALSSRNSAFCRRSSFSRLSRLLPAPGRDGLRAAFGGRRFDGFVGVASARARTGGAARAAREAASSGRSKTSRIAATNSGGAPPALVQRQRKVMVLRRPADVKMQRFDDGRRIETEIRRNIGEPLRAASLGPGKKAGKTGKISCAAQIQQAFAGENRRVWMRRILAAHRHNWHMGRKPGRQNGQSIRNVLVAQARRAAKPGHVALSFLCKHG